MYKFVGGEYFSMYLKLLFIKMVYSNGFGVDIISNNYYERLNRGQSNYVALDNNSEYKLRLTNDRSTDAMAEVHIEGEKIGVWLIPAQTNIVIDRPADVARKFTFLNERDSTAIAAGVIPGDTSNGLIKVVFYPKKPINIILFGLRHDVPPTGRSLAPFGNRIATIPSSAAGNVPPRYGTYPYSPIISQGATSPFVPIPPSSPARSPFLPSIPPSLSSSSLSQQRSLIPPVSPQRSVIPPVSPQRSLIPPVSPSRVYTGQSSFMPVGTVGTFLPKYQSGATVLGDSSSQRFGSARRFNDSEIDWANKTEIIIRLVVRTFQLNGGSGFISTVENTSISGWDNNTIGNSGWDNNTIGNSRWDNNPVTIKNRLNSSIPPRIEYYNQSFM